ncbi:major facilitator superfamily domain-containing protein [Scleroderma citrinum]
MWMQAVAIILPRVQVHYAVPDSYIGVLSSSMFAGMMVGAVGWGTCSDVMGRVLTFNATLFFTALFGFLASFAHSFAMLCMIFFLLGSAVGGSIPTDGTLLLEHVPRDKRYLVTGLSVFFSIGSVISALAGLLLIPRHSCLPNRPCNPPTDNQGWRYMLIGLGVITLSMFLARILFFRLNESPRYLVRAGRDQEALETLQFISRFNGDELLLELTDVDDHLPFETRAQANDFVDCSEPLLLSSRVNTTMFSASTHGYTPSGTGVADIDGINVDSAQTLSIPPCPDSPERQPAPWTSHIVVEAMGKYSEETFAKWVDRVWAVLSPQWFRTMALISAVWFCTALAYTLFNVFFPKLLETRSGYMDPPRSLEDNLWDVVIFTLGGFPGAILGAFMVESSLGRRGSLAGMTALTAICCLMFVQARGSLMIRMSSLGINLCAMTMLAIKYGWTPELFGTEVRGTACGLATALSRIGGIIAPLLGGALLSVNRTLPVYASVVVYVFMIVFVLLLRETRGRRDSRSLSHRVNRRWRWSHCLMR